MEKDILSYWKQIDAFKTSLKMSKGKKRFSFYDGPPFATGHPHYGHILAGTIKDIVTRFAHQTGHHVERRFGWDTHGLPVEYEIDKKLNINSIKDVLKLGIDNYNSECRKIVMRYSSEWKETIERCGRWVDFENDYKTLNLSYMESVWWVFKTVYNKGLIYRGYKIMPYSLRLGTSMSNFEANLNYKDVNDPSITIKFKIKNKNEYFLVWTTTPWTLPSNLALCVKSSLSYIKISDPKSNEIWILAESRLSELYKKPKDRKNLNILSKFKGKDLVGIEYEPLFEFFKHYKNKGAFKVLSDDYVSDKSGTGIVHQAPGFGEDDYRVCLSNGIVNKNEKVLCPINENGYFTDQVPTFKDIYIKDADSKIIKILRKRNLIAKESQHYHSYPFCWRSDTPLIYKAVPNWFLNVQMIKENLINNTKNTKWVPGYVKDKRFMNWIKDACDWAISRSRFWGTPLPVWSDEKFEEIVVIGSVEQLEKLSGVKNIKDIHRDKIDKIEIKSSDGKKSLKRINEVFDCWFESGSMPYGQLHYPFENKKVFEETFPADFIGEGLDQTRGWFYTLMVLSTALFDKPAFKNLICNGLVLAQNGKKMSKRLKNYPSPNDILDKFGADALRIYLINSPVVRAESLKFSSNGVYNVIKDVFLLWFNTYRFFIENATRFETENKQKFKPNFSVYNITENKLDKWVISSLQSLILSVRVNMKNYELSKVTPELVKFLSQLSLWYVRFNRDRMKGLFGERESLLSLQCLHYSLFTLCRLMAPFTPFITEKMYQNLKLCFNKSSEFYQKSIHFLMIPNVEENAIKKNVERAIKRLQNVIELGRHSREAKNIKFKQPLEEITIVNSEKEYLNDVNQFIDYIKMDLNIRKVNLSNDMEKFVKFKCIPNLKALGKRLRNKLKPIITEISKLKNDEIKELKLNKKIKILNEIITLDEIKIEIETKDKTGRYSSAVNDGCCVILDTKLTDDLIEEGLVREFCSAIQRLKKKHELNPTTNLTIFYSTKNEDLKKTIENNKQKIKKQIGRMVYQEKIFNDYLSSYSFVITEEVLNINQFQTKITLIRPSIIFSSSFLSLLKKNEKKELKTVFDYLISKNFEKFKNQHEKENLKKIEVQTEEKLVVLEKGKDYLLSVEEGVQANKFYSKEF